MIDSLYPERDLVCFCQFSAVHCEGGVQELRSLAESHDSDDVLISDANDLILETRICDTSTLDVPVPLYRCAAVDEKPE